MEQPHDATLDVFSQVGVAITPDPRGGCGWGWSITNARLTQPWVGPHPTREAAIAAALSWLMEQAWRGVLCPHLHGAHTSPAQAPEALPACPTQIQAAEVPPAATPDIAPAAPIDERLLAPWERMLRDHGL